MTASIAATRAGFELGPYRVLSHLASGGMADLWLAESMNGNEAGHVVLKTMRAEVASSPKLAAMFVEEAHVAATLRHDNVVRVFDVGLAEGTHYIAMELVRGATLRQIAQRFHERKQHFDTAFLLRVLLGVCDALDYVHGVSDEEGWPLSLVHGDVSPENIMVSFTGAVKLIDFGVSRAAGVMSSAEGAMIVGKPWYSAPECFGSDVVDLRSDLYSVGVILYEHLTGRRPYVARTKEHLIAQVLSSAPAAPDEIARNVSSALSSTTLRAMARDPGERFASASELAAALGQHLEELETVLGASAPPLDLQMLQLFGEREAVSSSVRFAPTASARRRAVRSSSLPTAPSDPATIEAALALVREASSPPRPPPASTFADEESPTRATAPAPRSLPAEVATPGRPRIPDLFAPRPAARSVASFTAAAAAPTKSGAWGPLSEQKLEAARMFDEGLAAMTKGDVEGAYAAWVRAVELDPTQRRYEANLRRLKEKKRSP